MAELGACMIGLAVHSCQPAWHHLSIETTSSCKSMYFGARSLAQAAAQGYN